MPTDDRVPTPPDSWAAFFAERKTAGIGSFWLPPEIQREMPLAFICGMVSTSGPNGEPLACGFKHGHGGEHAWATLPTYTAANGVSDDAHGSFPRRCKACDRDDVELREAHWANPMGKFGTPRWFHDDCGDQLDAIRSREEEGT